MKLPGYKRTILKSRVARHPDADKMRTQLGLTSGVTNLSVADLVQLAHALGIACPSDDAEKAYAAVKASGQSAAQARLAADRADAGSYTPAHGAQNTAPDTDTDTDEDDTPEPHDAPETQEAPDVTQTTQTPAPDPAEKAAQEAVSAVLAPMGRGDMAGFQAALQALAIKAVTPPPAPVQTYYADPAKIKGTVPQVIGKKTMTQAGIAAMATANEQATALDVYDAPDAPQIDADYAWPDAYTAPAMAALRRGRNVFLYGPAGTGKTTFAEQLAARYGRPFVRVSCDDQTEAATLTGATVPDGNGGVTWQDGQLVAAIRRPGTVILIDEPSVARPGALMVMQALLDGARAIALQETGERVQVAPGVLFLAADNTNGTGDETGAYEGTRRLNRAYLDRFCATFRLDYMPTAQEAQVIAKRTGLRAPHALEIAKFATLTRSGAQSGDVSHGLGIRRLFSLAEMIADGVAPDLALQVTVIETAPHEDREPLRQMWTAHVTPKSFK